MEPFVAAYRRLELIFATFETVSTQPRRLALLQGSELEPDLRRALEEAGYTVVERSAADLSEYDDAGALCPAPGDLDRLLRYWEHHHHLVVHDLKSPFAGLSAYLEVLNMEPPRSGPLAKATDGAVECAGELRHMLQAIVDLHRINLGELHIQTRACDLRDVAARGTAAFVASRQSGRLEEDFGSEPVHAVCDPTITANIVGQLVIHALRYAADRGDVQVSVSSDASDPALRVLSNGGPLPESALEALFQRYARASPLHEQDSYLFGLGLPFAHAAASAQGGTLTAENQPNGLLFTLTLPNGGVA